MSESSPLSDVICVNLECDKLLRLSAAHNTTTTTIAVVVELVVVVVVVVVVYCAPKMNISR